MRKIAALVALITVWSCSVEKDSDTNRMNGELGEVKMPSGPLISPMPSVTHWRKCALMPATITSSNGV